MQMIVSLCCKIFKECPVSDCSSHKIQDLYFNIIYYSQNSMLTDLTEVESPAENFILGLFGLISFNQNFPDFLGPGEISTPFVYK